MAGGLAAIPRPEADRARGSLATVVRVLGLIVAFAAVEHGVGEIAQGPVNPGSLAIESWPGTQPFEIVSGEPAMTILPNLLVAGLVTVILGGLFAAWAWDAAARPHGGPGLIALSALLLLVGGGFAPPIMGVILGVSLLWQPRGQVTGRRATFARAWRPLLVITVLAYLSLVPGLVALSAVIDTDLTAAAIVLPLVAFGGLLGSLAAARWADAANV